MKNIWPLSDTEAVVLVKASLRVLDYVSQFLQSDIDTRAAINSGSHGWWLGEIKSHVHVNSGLEILPGVVAGPVPFKNH